MLEYVTERRPRPFSLSFYLFYARGVCVCVCLCVCVCVWGYFRRPEKHTNTYAFIITFICLLKNTARGANRRARCTPNAVRKMSTFSMFASTNICFLLNCHCFSILVENCLDDFPGLFSPPRRFPYLFLPQTRRSLEIRTLGNCYFHSFFPAIVLTYT